jgi:hypothetical protein
MIPGVQEIKALALKYSKKQLANMAQTGLIDPQKAVMAGMMRDRIAKEDMQPPSTTVAQDVLGLAPQQQMGMQPPPQPQMAQARPQPQPQMPPPQMGAPMEQPPVMAASGGMTSLPVEIQDYAGGGIVAFGDGGDTSSPLGRKLSSVFGGKTYDAATTQELQSLDQQFRALSARDRELSGMFGLQQQTPEQQAEAAQVRQQLDSIFQRSQQLKSGNAPTASPTTFTPVTAPAPDAAPAPAPAPPRREAPPRAGRDAGPRGPAGPSTSALKRPDPASYLPDLTQLKPEEFSTRAAQELPAIGKERMDYMRSMGVDPQMYERMIAKEEGKRGDLAKRKEEAKGLALMEASLGLIGARRGEEFQRLGESGRRGLANLAEAGKELRASEEKLDDRINSFRMADQQFKQTGAEKDLTKRENEINRVEAAKREAVKDRNTFTTVRAQLGMEGAKIRSQGEISLYGQDLQADLERQKIKIQQQQVANQASYYNKSLALTEARIKSMDQASQAKFLKLRQESDRMFEASPEYRALTTQLKGQYGDNYANAEKAKVAMEQAKKMYFAQQLEGIGALSSAAVDESTLR